MARDLDKPHKAVIAAAAAAAVVTLLAAVLPTVQIADRSQSTHAAIETAATLIAGVAAMIFAGRFLRAAERRDLLVAVALGLLAVTNGVFSLAPTLADREFGPFLVWSSLLGRTGGAILLVLAAFLPYRRLGRPRRTLAGAAVLMVGSLAALAGLVALLGGGLPTADSDVAPEALGRFSGPASIAAVYAVLTLLYAAAAVGFTRQTRGRADELTIWLGVAAAVAAFARVNYFLFPSIGSDWIYAGDLLRLAFYLLLLAGALREVVAYQRQAATTAVYEERRRMARDLHDGLAQDLAFIASQSQRLIDRHRPEVAQLISEAAVRALDESRVALGALTRPADESLREALESTVSDLARRGGATVVLDVDDDATTPVETKEALVRIAGEAVNNSMRHGGASTVRVELECANGLRMVVSDDGCGFTPEEVSVNGGFGVISMRERAEALGGRLTVDSAPGRGAKVEVRVP